MTFFFRPNDLGRAQYGETCAAACILVVNTDVPLLTEGVLRLKVFGDEDGSGSLAPALALCQAQDWLRGVGVAFGRFRLRIRDRRSVTRSWDQ